MDELMCGGAVAQKKRISSRTGLPANWQLSGKGLRLDHQSDVLNRHHNILMKSLFLLVVLVIVNPAVAFVAQPASRRHAGGKFVAPLLMTKKTVTVISSPPSPSTTTVSSNNNDVVTSSSRRDSLRSLTTSILLTTSSFLLTSSSLTANAALDTYLTEPTEEFKESERQRMEFRKKQLSLKADFVKVLAHLTSDESSTQEALVTDLKELRSLVTQTGGLPLGIKKEDMYKVIRSKKAKGFWPTDVEIA
jgi:hypothetical protein